jgi:hypothetical protein
MKLTNFRLGNVVLQSGVLCYSFHLDLFSQMLEIEMINPKKYTFLANFVKKKYVKRNFKFNSCTVGYRHSGSG